MPPVRAHGHEDRYRTLFESIDQGFCILEVILDERGRPHDYRFLEANSAFEELVGHRSVAGMRMRDIVLPEDDPWFGAYANVAATGRPFRFRRRAEHLGGRWFDVDVFRLDAPEARHVGVLFSDVTEEVKTQEALQRLTETLEDRVDERTRQMVEQEERFRRLVEASAAMVWMTDSAGAVSEDSPTWRAFTGQDADAWQRDAWQEAVHPDDREHTATLWQRAVETGVPTDYESRIYHAATDAYRWTNVRATPLRDEAGAVRGWIGMNIDIDDRKRAQHRVRELAKRLSAAEQEERRRIAQVLHDDLQQILHGIEIKLGSVARGLEDVGRENLIQQIAEVRQWVAVGVKTTRRLTADLSPLMPNRTEMADVIGGLVQQMADRHGLHVAVEAERPFPVEDEGMRVMLFQIVRELLFNVAKHSGAQDACVRLHVDRGHLAITVSDEGTGFDAEKAMADAEPPAGFGLFSIRERLSLTGGSLQVHAAPGEGTRVEVLTPVAVPAEAPERD